MTTMDATTMIRELREKTGAGMMDCKKALDEAKGNLEGAITILRKKGMADAAKKATRATKEGAVAFKTEGKAGAIVEINCETDFVAKGADFGGMVKTVVEQALSGKLASVEAGNESIVKPMVGKLGENMALRRFARFELAGSGLIAGYEHRPDHALPAKRGALIELSCAKTGPELEALAKTLLLQIVGAAAKYLTRDEVPAEDIAKEKEIHTEVLRKEGKPEASIPKIIEGKINKLFYQAWVLTEQPWQQDPKKTVTDLLKDASAKLGAEVKIVRFARYQLGE
jgi:elongation factor Ts